ncbi:MAG: hypothetical protein KatS3mg130_1693 [Candidatus Sumerlaea sp.]|nr:MAG: hypothetical protein KatS3mg130_1693 [Candidatus Sumerlaea sp.]
MPRCEEKSSRTEVPPALFLYDFALSNVYAVENRVALTVYRAK